MRDMKISAYISTKNRYNTTLPIVINGIANQKYLPSEVIIYDDGDRIDFRQHPVMKHALEHLQQKGVNWRVVFGEGVGQVKNHQKAINDCVSEWIWRLDDDTVPEPDVLLNFVDYISLNHSVGAIAGLVPETNSFKYNNLNSSKIEDIFLGLNVQWFKQKNEVLLVDHLYSTFMYRKDLAVDGYDMNLSKVGFREETMFTYNIKRKGFDLVVLNNSITWHYRQDSGGTRSQSVELYINDENIFKNYLKEKNVNVNKYKIVCLDNGIGDHIVFESILEDLLEKYKDEKIIIGVCYKEPFKEYFNNEHIQFTSIDNVASIANVFDYNIYAWMDKNKWKDSLQNAYKKMYRL